MPKRVEARVDTQSGPVELTGDLALEFAEPPAIAPTMENALRDSVGVKPKPPNLKIEVSAVYEPLPEPVCARLEWLLKEVVGRAWAGQGVISEATNNLRGSYPSREAVLDEVRELLVWVDMSRAFRKKVVEECLGVNVSWEAYLKSEREYAERMDPWRKNPWEMFQKWLQDQKKMDAEPTSAPNWF